MDPSIQLQSQHNVTLLVKIVPTIEQSETIHPPCTTYVVSRIPLPAGQLLFSSAESYVTCCFAHAEQFGCPFLSQASYARDTVHRSTVHMELYFPAFLRVFDNDTHVPSMCVLLNISTGSYYTVFYTRIVCPCCLHHATHLSLPHVQHPSLTPILSHLDFLRRSASPSTSLTLSPALRSLPRPDSNATLTVATPTSPATSHSSSSRSRPISAIYAPPSTTPSVWNTTHPTVTFTPNVVTTTSSVAPSTLSSHNEGISANSGSHSTEAPSSAIESQAPSLTPSDAISSHGPRSSIPAHAPTTAHTAPALPRQQRATTPDPSSLLSLFASPANRGLPSTLTAPPPVPSPALTNQSGPTIQHATTSMHESFTLLALQCVIIRHLAIRPLNSLQLRHKALHDNFFVSANILTPRIISLSHIETDYAVLTRHLHQHHAAQFASASCPPTSVRSTCISKHCIFYPRDKSGTNLSVLQQGFNPSKAITTLQHWMPSLNASPAASPHLSVLPGFSPEVIPLAWNNYFIVDKTLASAPAPAT